jgi:gp16 family phage-associated protein
MALKSGNAQGVKTPEQVKKDLLRQGKTMLDLSKEIGHKYETVSAVINGRNKGNRGNAHKVAVALGLKEAA